MTYTYYNISRSSEDPVKASPGERSVKSKCRRQSSKRCIGHSLRNYNKPHSDTCQLSARRHNDTRSLGTYQRWHHQLTNEGYTFLSSARSETVREHTQQRLVMSASTRGTNPLPMGLLRCMFLRLSHAPRFSVFPSVRCGPPRRLGTLSSYRCCSRSQGTRRTSK